MALDPDRLDEDVLTFLRERHLAMLTTARADGSPHMAAVGFAYSPHERLVRIITPGGSQKAVNAGRGGRAVVGQVDGPRWLSLEGEVRLVADADGIAAAVAAYAERYQEPRPREGRVAIEIAVDRILGRG